MNPERTSTDGRKRFLLLLAAFFCLQLVFVFFGKQAIPITSVSDDRIYLRLAANIAAFEAPYSFQYPLFYPFIVALTQALQVPFGLAPVLFTNALLKVAGILLTARLLKTWLAENDAEILAFLAFLSPVSFVYSARVMSENLYIPLLIFVLLLHLKHRRRLAEEQLSASLLLLLTAMAAFSAWLLIDTRYVSILLMPLTCLLWSSAALKGRRFPRFLASAILYTGVVLLLIAGHALLLSLKMGEPFSLSFVKQTLGFGVASGPDAAGGLRLIPERKWVLCYSLYALLGALIPAAAILRSASPALLRRCAAHVAALAGTGLIFVYASARHSTLAWYNANGHMEKILGRYVSPTTPLLLLLAPLVCEVLSGGLPGSSRQKGSVPRAAAAALFGAAVPVLTWLFLYRNVYGWDMKAGFADGNRGLDLIGFSKAGVFAVILYAAAAAANAFFPGKRTFRLTLVLCFAFQILMVFA